MLNQNMTMAVSLCIRHYRISKLVDDAKQNTQWRKQFMDLEIEKKYAYREGESKGRIEGAKQHALETARNFLNMKVLTIEQIAKGTGLSKQEVEALAKEVKKD